MNCKTLQSQLPEIVLNPGDASSEVLDHLAVCPPCEQEYTSLLATISAMDAWIAPEPSAYFDQKLAVLLREEAAMPKLGFFARLREHVLFNTGRQFRPMLAGGLVLILMVGGGGYASFQDTNHPHDPAQVSAALTDLEKLDKNEQTLQQMDQLLQDDDSGDDSAANAPS